MSLLPFRYFNACVWLTGGNGAVLVVERGAGVGAGVQGIDGVLVMPSAARMSAWAHPCDQHLAQALPLMYPTATERFEP